MSTFEFQMPTLGLNIKREITINGKAYRSVEEMPADVRALFDQAMALQAENGRSSSTAAQIVFNGTEHATMETLPPDMRQLSEQARQAAGAGAASPALDPAHPGHVLLNQSKPLGRVRLQANPPSATIEFSLSPRTLIVIGVIGVLLLLLFYFLR